MRATRKKLTITTLLRASKLCREKQIRNSITQYGLPKNGAKTTDYLVLQTAVMKNHKNIVQILIDAGCRINATENDSGKTPLAIAVTNKNLEIATLLLEKGANFEIGNESDLTVLHLAAQQKSLKMLQLLFQYNVDINCFKSKKTAFQMFFDSTFPYCQLDHQDNIEILKLFLSNGASIYINHDWNVLHFVTTTKHKDIIQLVLQATNNVNQCTNQGNTSLHHLLKDSSLDENDIVEVVQSFILKGARVDIPNSQGDTVCHEAANKKYLKVLQVFFQCQWDVNYCNSESNTVIHNLLENSSSFCTDDLYYQVVTSILNLESFKFVQNNSEKFPIHLAIENNHKQIVYDMLLKPGFDVNTADKKLCNYTILHFYLKNLVDTGSSPDDLDIEIIRQLILMGVQADTISDEKSKTTPMHFALMLKNKTILQLLLDNFSFQKFAAEQNKSILHYIIHNIDYSSEAQELEMVEVVDVCIKKGADINFRDEQSKTPVSAAALNRQKHMVKILLENGAEINDFDSRMILEGFMAYVPMTSSPSSKSPNYLMVKHINIAEEIAKDIEMLELLSAKGMGLESKSSNGFTIFHYAATKKYTEMISKLLPYCQNTNVRDSNENTVLHTILRSYMNTDNETENKLIEIVSALISKEALVLIVNDKGEMPLHLAAKNKHFEICQILLQHGAYPTALDNNGNSVLHCLSTSNFETNENAVFDLVTLFVGLGCEINAKNNEGMTPLLLAAHFGCAITTKVLLQCGAKIDCTIDDNLSMSLHVAAERNHSGVSEQLIKFSVDINATRKHGQTALHISVSHKESQVTKILLESGADTEIRDNNGKTALHWACWYNNFENVNELLNYGANVNAEDEFQVIPLMLIQPSADIWKTIYYHVIKLQAADMMISNLSKKCILEYEQAHANELHVSIANEYFATAFDEVLKMKETPIDKDFNLFDVLQISPRSLCRINSNQNFQNFLNFSDLGEKFPVYDNLIRACYRRALVRNGLLNLANVAFVKIIGLTLDDNCCEQIFYHLSNHDLRQLDKAAKIRLRKRKRTEVDRNTVSPLEKRRRASSL